MDRYLMISTDGHAGLRMEGYRNYLESKHHAAFARELPLQREATAQAEEMLFFRSLTLIKSGASVLRTT